MANVFITVFILAVILEDFHALVPFAREAWTASVRAYEMALAWLAQAVSLLQQALA